VIEKDMPGVSFGAQEKKLGWHSQPTCQVNFDEVRVPAENLVGAEGEGFRIAMMGLDGGRSTSAPAPWAGAALPRRGGALHQGAQGVRPAARRLPEHAVHARRHGNRAAGRALLLYAAAVKVTENAPDKTRFAAMAKRLATDTGSSVVDRALQLHGGYGYLQDYPIERFWRDLRVHSILEGTNQIMRHVVARDMLRQ
jgi:alkylation response protein AidB-like acyl-CoA dehydrogenase